jgi:cobalamin biosynthesis Co2+ chelatase CbiK
MTINSTAFIYKDIRNLTIDQINQKKETIKSTKQRRNFTNQMIASDRFVGGKVS